jgi:hypothetical protein
MSDDISIPSPIYRVPRHSRGLDPATRRLALIAAGIGGTLLAVVGGSSMLSHRSHSVPVVEAEPGPMRVRPANPGGLQVAGVNNDIFSGGSDTDVEKLAPPPQTPDPQALRALPAPKPAAAAAAREHAASPPDHEHAAIAAVQPPPEPARVPAEHAPVTAVALAARPAVKPGSAVADHTADRKDVVVQLAALTSEPAAKAEWDRLTRLWPGLLAGHHPAFSKIDHDGQTLWRLRTGGFDDAVAATTFCQRLRAKGGGCSVADF